MTFDFEIKVGDSVRSFNDFHGTVTQLNYLKGALSSVTVRWMNGRVMTHPCTAEDIWLEGHPAKEDPDVKAHKWFVAHQDEINANNLVLQEAYRLAIKKAVDAQATLVWEPEPLYEDATLEQLADRIASWSGLVKSLDGNIKDDLIQHDLFTREWIHGLLNGLKRQGIVIPADLLEILAQADQYFIDHSIALAPPDIKSLNNLSPEKTMTVQDLDVFWYEYLWPRVQCS